MFANYCREGRCEDKDRVNKEGDPDDSGRGEDAIASDDGHQVSDATSGSHNQEAAVDILGDCAKNWSRWQTAA